MVWMKNSSLIVWSVKKYTENLWNPKLVNTKNGRIMLSSNCVACGSKQLRFI